MIKTKIIKTAKAEILVIGELPEDTGYVAPILGDLFYAKEEGNWNLYMGKSIIPPGKWQPVGFLDKIPEDVAKELVDKVTFDKWVNYSAPNYWEYLFDTATESLRSLVEANVKMVNPLGEKPVKKVTGGLLYLQNYEKAIRSWQAEEEKLYHNLYLLKRID